MNVATWNVCLGFKNKKDYIYETLRENEIMICAIKEAEIKKDFDPMMLSSKDYKIEVEKSSSKARLAMLFHNSISYERKFNLEQEDSSVIVVDINVKNKY